MSLEIRSISDENKTSAQKPRWRDVYVRYHRELNRNQRTSKMPWLILLVVSLHGRTHQFDDYGFFGAKGICSKEGINFGESFCQLLRLEAVTIVHCLADLFTKALPEDRFKYLIRRLGMRCLTPDELEVLENESA
ncbi:hypothetical protein Tco_0942927 [Tanacetum coccineum]